jgi:hypothetical protein
MGRTETGQALQHGGVANAFVKQKIEKTYLDGHCLMLGEGARINGNLHYRF